MSELKAHNINDLSLHDIANCEFYIKSEADKVFADLEQKLAAAQQMLRLNEPKALYSNLETMGRLKHEIDVVARRERHHKYKRCLAMAKWCEERSARYDVLQERHNLDWGREIEFYYRWYMRWLELAEKFKEVK